MAYEESLKCVSHEASGDLSASQYCFVSLNSSAQVAVTGDGSAADGVLQDNPAAAGRAAAVGIGGITKLRCGAAVSAGDAVAPDSNGRAVTATTGEVVGAIALEDGAGNGSIIAARLVLSQEPLA